MIIYEQIQAAEAAIAVACNSAMAVFRELAGTSEESRFEKALEIALRLDGLAIELQRIVPVLYRGYALRDVRDELDIVMWVSGDDVGFKKLGIVVELKVDAEREAPLQVVRYIKSLSRALPPDEAVYFRGLLISFPFAGIQFCESTGAIDGSKSKVQTTTLEVEEM